MIIDTQFVIVTLILVGLGLYAGLLVVRKFALTIAQENLDANMANDAADETKRLKRQRDADIAAQTAFAKVEPLLPPVSVPVPPRSGNGLEMESAKTSPPLQDATDAA